MNEQIRLFIVTMSIFFIGMVAGYLLNEIMVMQDYAKECTKLCNEYMELQHCIWSPEQPPFNMSLIIGGEEDYG